MITALFSMKNLRYDSKFKAAYKFLAEPKKLFHVYPQQHNEKHSSITIVYSYVGIEYRFYFIY